MVDWQSEAEQVKDAQAFEKLIYALFGLFVWEMFQTSGFEWSLLTRRRKFSWPMIFYFLCRYCMLFALIGLVISFNVTTRVNCQALYVWNSWTGNMAILCASTSLMIRTIAIWERRPIIIVPLLVICLAHWGLLYHGIIIVRASWDSTQAACVVFSTNPTFLTVNFFFTMCFDLVILIFTTMGLLRSSNRSGLWQLLFRDGLVFWGISFTVNAIPAILNSLNLNTSMNIIGTVPAATLSTIAACRCFARLQDYNHSEVYAYSQSATVNGVPVDGRVAARLGPGKPPRFATTRPEVQIVTDQITMENLEGARAASMQFTVQKKPSRDVEETSFGSEEDKRADPDMKYNVV